MEHVLGIHAPRLDAFLTSQAGHDVCLALNDWRNERLGDGLYRCYAERTTFLAYEVAPVVELSVLLTGEAECCVRLESARLEGSDALRQQSERFIPSAVHTISWQSDGAVTVLVSDVELAVR